jgi:hypothetical protein
MKGEDAHGSKRNDARTAGVTICRPWRLYRIPIMRFTRLPFKPWPLTLAVLLGIISIARADEKPAGVTSENNEKLRKGLQMYPEADTNKDGILTIEEARAFLKKMNLTEDQALGKKPPTSAAGGGAEPTMSDVKYGPFERNVLDFWKANSDKPTPVVVYIHGGGFRSGDKSSARHDKLVRQCLDAGVSFAAINYRFRLTAPLPDVLRDCARAIQFIRSKSADWNVDKTRIASFGGSAGAGTSLWLAFHDDLADPKSDDPVLRESSKIVCAGANSCQFSYDVFEWPKLFGEDVCKRFSDPNDDWAAFYGLKSADDLNSPVGLKVRHDCDMCGLIRKGAPPVFLSSTQRGGDITDRGHYLHHPKHAEAVKRRCDEIGVECVAQIPGLKIAPPADGPQDLREFLFKHLGVSAR